MLDEDSNGQTADPVQDGKPFSRDFYFAKNAAPTPCTEQSNHNPLPPVKPITMQEIYNLSEEAAHRPLLACEIKKLTELEEGRKNKMKNIISIIVATLLIAVLIFMPGCKQYTIYEGNESDNSNTVTFYEFVTDLKAGQKIDCTMLKEIKVDLNATAFVTNGGIAYSLDSLNETALLTPDYFDEIITGDAYVAISSKRGEIVKIGIIQKGASAFVDAVRLIENISQGEQITEEHLELVSNINANFIPKGTISDPNEVIGKYAATDLLFDTYLTPEDIYDSELQVTLRNIAEELLDVATFHGMFAGPFEDKIIELQNRYFQFDVEYSAEEWFNKEQKKVQLGDAMTVTVSIDPKLRVSVVGYSQNYWFD